MRRDAVLISLTLVLTAYASGRGVVADHWTNADGLPVNSVRGICQTPEGYLWLATWDGIVRFDGVRFVQFSKTDTPGILSDRFAGLLCSADGGFWGRTEGQGVTRYLQGRFRTYTERDGLNSTVLLGLTESEAGDVWALTGKETLRFDRARDRFVPLPRDEFPYQDALLPAGAGFYGRDAQGLHLFQRGRRQDYPLPADWQLKDVMLSLDGSAGLTLLDGRSAHFRDGKWQLLPPGETAAMRLESRVAPSMAHPNGKARDGGARAGAGPAGSREALLNAELVPDLKYINILVEDRDGDLWMATESMGLYRFRSRSVEMLTMADGLSHRNVYTVFESKDGAVWSGSLDGTVSRYSNGKFTSAKTTDIASIAEDRQGRLWLGGLPHRQVNGKLERLKMAGLPDKTKAAHEDRHGAMWLGGPEGLHRLDPNGTWRRLTHQDGLAGDDIQVIVDAVGGGLWAGGMGGLSYIAENGTIRRWNEADGLPSNNVRSLYQDSAGVLWIGTYDGGLGRLEQGRMIRYTLRDGLFDKGVFQILEDHRGNLWFSCNRGIYRVPKQELNDFAAGRRRSINSFRYGRQDGMITEECNGGASPAGFRARDGRLWFPTQDGIAIIDPDRIAGAPNPPPPAIESVRIDQAVTPLDQPVRLQPGHENLEIQYTGLRLRNASQIRFRVWLSELDRDWVEVGQRRTAYYQHLPPGSYTFRVAAAMADGAWNPVAAELPVVVLPAYYQTWWFRLLGGLLTAALFWSYWRHRIGRLEGDRVMRQAFSRQLIASQENERKRIAGELHDSLGQRLVVIKNRALLLLNKRDAELPAGPIREQLESISAEVSEAVREVKEISYDLRPYRLDRLGLTTALKGMIETAAASSGIAFATGIDNVDGVFPGQAEINFYRIVQECVNNILRHSGATEASVRVQRSGEHLQLTVQDNGCGFTPGTVQGGFGLAGVRERTQLLAGKLELKSAPGQGTTVTIGIDLLLI